MHTLTSETKYYVPKIWNDIFHEAGFFMKDFDTLNRLFYLNPRFELYWLSSWSCFCTIFAAI